MIQRILLGVAFYFLWIGLSGHFSPFLVATSLISVVGVVLLLTHLGLVARQFQPFSLVVPLVIYWGWLLVEIVKSNIDVARCVLGLGRPATPSMAWIETSQKSELCRTLYGNSITLTPGTFTVLAEGDRFLVHALHREGIAALQDGEMDRRCLALDEKFRGRIA
ncbi:Na+/H+ antiporter subunit E [Zavarzinia compransoris]|uniref:Na+/H+ antiporter subunit E n=1 Tax=Zavarzinia marina TaxID=2911065 RepID=UPI001F3E7817|nr:Na+/H+ antiporter subunit E [Zavarzinia marina]MCF4164103.1 Na+/H+ antiporter subunit E [Zavarzinia marina]